MATEKKNYFKELASISVKDKIEKKGKFSYLSWASAWSLIKTAHPSAQRVVYESEHTGLNFFTDGKTAYCKVDITLPTSNVKILLKILWITLVSSTLSS